MTRFLMLLLGAVFIGLATADIALATLPTNTDLWFAAPVVVSGILLGITGIIGIVLACFLPDTILEKRAKPDA